MNKEQADNKLLNTNEYFERRIRLESTPPNVILATSYNCNMHCMFCAARGNEPNFGLDIYKNLYENKLGPVIAKATHLFFGGWGEVLLLPEAEELIDYLNSSIPQVNKSFTTNGAALNSRMIRKISESDYTLQISLHTSDPMVHRMITGSGYFQNIKNSLQEIHALKKESNLKNPYINLVFILNTLNVENLPDFVDFAGQLGVEAVTCSYMIAYKEEDIKLSCFFLKDTTNRMFEEAKTRAKRFDLQLNLPPPFNTAGNLSKITPCSYPWDHVFIDTTGSIRTCCFAGEPIGELKDNDFNAIWNGSEYCDLRRAIIAGEFHKRCQSCFKFVSFNVDDLRSHITMRPSEQARVFDLLGLKQGELK